jgi:hypothetical protein
LPIDSPVQAPPDTAKLPPGPPRLVSGSALSRDNTAWPASSPGRTLRARAWRTCSRNALDRVNRYPH